MDISEAGQLGRRLISCREMPWRSNDLLLWEKQFISELDMKKLRQVSTKSVPSWFYLQKESEIEWINISIHAIIKIKIDRLVIQSRGLPQENRFGDISHFRIMV